MNNYKSQYNVAIIGVSGLVGRTMLRILEEKKFPTNAILPLASSRSAGQYIKFNDKEIQIQELNENSFINMDIALFSAGSDVSKKYAPIAVKSGCVVVDNGSFWRMNNNVPLVVPEVNPEDLEHHQGIIANPNCSTIQFVVPLFAINKKFHVTRSIISTYQAISGAGQKGINKLKNEIQGIKNSDKHKIYNNIMFHSPICENDYTGEEIKMLNETRKILHIPNFDLAVTCVRIPVENSHSISVYMELDKPFSISAIKECMASQHGIVLIDDIKNEEYPTPQASNGSDEIFVGRIRQDINHENGLYMWIVADNLRKGAATNAVQIAEILIKENLLIH